MLQTLIKDEKRVEFLIDSDGEFEAKLELQDIDNNKTREFLGIDGSDINISKEGSVTSIYNDYNNSLNYEMKFDKNGVLFAIISKLVPKIDKNRNLGIVYYELEEIVSYEMLSSYLDGGLSIDTYKNSENSIDINTQIQIDANYTTDKEFSINIDTNLTVIFTPLETSTFKEVTKLNKSKEVTLLRGKCNIKTQKNDENFTFSNLNDLRIDTDGIYLKDNLNESENLSLKLEKGWNLISIPISGYIFSDKFKSDTIWSYNNRKWTKNPQILKHKQGYWVFSDNKYTLNFEGFIYDRELFLESNEWYLLGNGVDLSYFEEYTTIFVFRGRGEWVKNPQVINRGEGFWIKK